VDHNTLDGAGTFHGMGIIAIITPVRKQPNQFQNKVVTAEDMASAGRINIRHYEEPSDGAEKPRDARYFRLFVLQNNSRF